MLIEVTQEHIGRGTRDNCIFCPIGLAIREVTSEAISVGKTSIYVGFNKIILPQEAVEFINKFDNGLEVKPFQFELELL